MMMTMMRSTSFEFYTVLVLCLLMAQPASSAVFIYTKNNTKGNTTNSNSNSNSSSISNSNESATTTTTTTTATYYPSLPANIGKAWVTGASFDAILSYVPSDPFLCNTTRTAPPDNNNINNNINNINNNNNPLPTAVLVSRGRCPVTRKARIAASRYGPQVEFLIVCNEPPDDQHDDALDHGPVITPIRGSSTSSIAKKLRITSVSYTAGVALVEYWKSSSNHNNNNSAKSGPTTNSVLPPVVSLMITQEEARGWSEVVTTPADDDDYEQQVVILTTPSSSKTGSSNSAGTNSKYNTNYGVTDQVLNPTLGMFCTILLLSTSFLLCLVAARPHRRRRRRGGPSSPGSGAGAGSGGGGGGGGGTTYMGRNLLTADEIDHYLTVSRHSSTPKRKTNKQQQQQQQVSPTRSLCCGRIHSPTSSSSSLEHQQNSEGNAQSSEEEEEEQEDEALLLHCAICLEDVKMDKMTVRLPCQHTFHHDCILPWLTERQGTCPLCKYDVYQYVQETAALDFSLSPHMAGILSRTRQHWRDSFLSVSSFLEDPFGALQDLDDDEEGEEEYGEYEYDSNDNTMPLETNTAIEQGHGDITSNPSMAPSETVPIVSSE
eukprot:CAMPEP_0168763220 /NCGR_PEP_ID=MMETSP0724-20121128/24246_1 /TAXON_ID=265536 /ORGANISM="Amphiprora sp., Strain CCMP467" /LENGTH=602 /DNA_ID=CAMNT_0008812407 /DNA_START=81 /DNA_END=1889 /DNA_ORIENTATION=+